MGSLVFDGSVTRQLETDEEQLINAQNKRVKRSGTRESQRTMQIKAEEISKIIRDQIGNYAVDVDVAEVGTVISVGDGIARIYGVERAMAGEMLEFPNGCSASR